MFTLKKFLSKLKKKSHLLCYADEIYRERINFRIKNFRAVSHFNNIVYHPKRTQLFFCRLQCYFFVMLMLPSVEQQKRKKLKNLEKERSFSLHTVFFFTASVSAQKACKRERTETKEPYNFSLFKT